MIRPFALSPALVAAVTLFQGVAAAAPAAPSWGDGGPVQENDGGPAAPGGYVFKAVDFKQSSVLDAVRILSEISGVNIIATDDAGRKVISMFIRQSTVHQAIESISRVSGLWYRYNRKSNSYIIMTAKEYQDNLVVFQETFTRIFTLRYQNVVETGEIIRGLFGSERVELSLGQDNALDSLVDDTTGSSSSSSSSSSSKSSSSSSQQSRYSTQTRRGKNDRTGQSLLDNKTQLSAPQLEAIGAEAQAEAAALGQDADGTGALRVSSARLDALKSRVPSIYVAVNRLHNIIYVRTSDEQALEQIARIVAESDRPTPQVLLEMKILELTVGDDFQSAFNLSFSSAHHSLAVGGSDSTQTGTLLYQFMNQQIEAQINLLEKESRVNVVATPMVLATNTTPARLFIGEERVLVTGYTLQTTVGSTGASVSTLTPETETRDVGTTLRIIPRINSDRTVTLKVEQDNSSINSGAATLPYVGTDGTLESMSIDTVSTANVNGVVTAQDGYTVAIGGLLRDSKEKTREKVPYLSDIPVLGHLFTSRVDADEKTELVVLITPHVFFTPSEAETRSRERVGANSANPGVERDGFSATRARESRGKDETLSIEDLIEAVRTAVLSHDGVASPGPGWSPVPPSTTADLALLPTLAATVRPMAGWAYGSGLYVTVAEVTNTSGSAVALDPRRLIGAWKAVSFSRPTLGGGERATAYLVSDRPLSAVLADLVLPDPATAPAETGGGWR